MKINVLSIIGDHFGTLRDYESRRISKADVVVFYLIPAVVSVAAGLIQFQTRLETYNVSITFFGIFIALLLNIQVGMFAVFQRKWDFSADPLVAKAQREVYEDRRALLTELNANLSYLVLVSCAALVLSLLFFVCKIETGVAPLIMTFLYSHFLLTLLMIVKRAHALFHKEYRDTQI